jgi:hypothetical protein
MDAGGRLPRLGESSHDWLGYSRESGPAREIFANCIVGWTRVCQIKGGLEAPRLVAVSRSIWLGARRPGNAPGAQPSLAGRLPLRIY